MWVPWEEEAWWDCAVWRQSHRHPRCVLIRLFRLMKQHFWNEVSFMYSYVIAYSKGSGIVTDMLDVTRTCYNFCPCGNCAWCGLHVVDVAATKKYLIHNCLLKCTCVSFLRCDNLLECLCTAVSNYLHTISSCLLQSTLVAELCKWLLFPLVTTMLESFFWNAL